MEGLLANTVVHSEVRLAFLRLLETDIDDEDEIRQLAADIRWVRDRRENEHKRNLQKGAILIGLISAALSAILSNLSSLWQAWHGKGS